MTESQSTDTKSNTNTNTNNIKHLVLSGGGLLGISYIGLLRYLEESNIVGNLKSISGSSAGSLFGCLIALRYTSKEIEIIVKTIKFKEYVNNETTSCADRQAAWKDFKSKVDAEVSKPLDLK